MSVIIQPGLSCDSYYTATPNRNGLIMLQEKHIETNREFKGLQSD